MFDSFPYFVGLMLLPFIVSLVTTILCAGRSALSKSYFLLVAIVGSFVVALIATASFSSWVLGTIIGAVAFGLILRSVAQARA
jgi:hypothetical protein